MVATRFWTFINVQNGLSQYKSGQNVKKRVVTIMLSFCFLSKIFCEHIFFNKKTIINLKVIREIIISIYIK